VSLSPGGLGSRTICPSARGFLALHAVAASTAAPPASPARAAAGAGAGFVEEGGAGGAWAAGPGPQAPSEALARLVSTTTGTETRRNKCKVQARHAQPGQTATQHVEPGTASSTRACRREWSAAQQVGTRHGRRTFASARAAPHHRLLRPVDGGCNYRDGSTGREPPAGDGGGR
jgi:hypothetical protein